MKLRQSGAAIRLRYICDSEGGVVTNYSEKIVLMNNGIEYYFVEVMSSSGTKYGIYAHERGYRIIPGNKKYARNKTAFG